INRGAVFLRVPVAGCGNWASGSIWTGSTPGILLHALVLALFLFDVLRDGRSGTRHARRRRRATVGLERRIARAGPTLRDGRQATTIVATLEAEPPFGALNASGAADGQTAVHITPVISVEVAFLTTAIRKSPFVGAWDNVERKPFTSR